MREALVFRYSGYWPVLLPQSGQDNPRHFDNQDSIWSSPFRVDIEKASTSNFPLEMNA
jgi:hypothetical protein